MAIAVDATTATVTGARRSRCGGCGGSLGIARGFLVDYSEEGGLGGDGVEFIHANVHAHGGHGPFEHAERWRSK